MSKEMQEQILDFIRDEYVEDDSIDIDAETPLISSGLVDSFSMVSLKMFLEDQYEIKMTDEEASTEAFDTVQAITELVQRKLEEKD
jgi:D-alanine--poly(phosphoribitol) ligase subunit 2